MKPRSQPRYKAPEGPKRQPKTDERLPWKPHHAGKSWTRAILILLANLFALQILAGLWWGYNLMSSPYRIHFDDRPARVRLDGKPQPLDSADGFYLSRLALGDHRLEYANASGATKTVAFHAHLSDGDDGLTVGEDRVTGFPKGEFVAGR